MSNERESPSTPHGEGQPYKIDTGPVPLDVLAEGPTGQTWYRIPSWRVYFDCEGLKGVDMRLHRSVESSAVWTLTEATTGFKVFGDLAHEFYVGDEGAMLAEFCAGLMLKMTPEKVATALDKARAELAKRPSNPFAESETITITRPILKTADGRDLLAELDNIAHFLDSENASTSARVVEDAKKQLATLADEMEIGFRLMSMKNGELEAATPAATYLPRAIDLLNCVKAWRDSDGNEGFPHTVREGIDALLVAYELRTQGTYAEQMQRRST